MSETKDKTSSAVRELGMKVRKEEDKVEENYYVKLATNMVTTVKETRLVEDDTQDTFLKGKNWLLNRSYACQGALGVALAFLFLGQGGHLIRLA